MNVLYINACVRSESRTDRLARKLLERFGAYTEVKLEETAPEPLGREKLEKRTNRIDHGDYSDALFQPAKQFAEADIIIVGAPYWDLSFPALLKMYLENIYVTGITSCYDEQGIPKGLCRGEKLYYVTTAGGKFDGRYGYDYVRDLAVTCFGIRETELIMAEMLDVDGYDPEEIMKKTLEEIENMQLGKEAE